MNLCIVAIKKSVTELPSPVCSFIALIVYGIFIAGNKDRNSTQKTTTDGSTEHKYRNIAKNIEQQYQRQ